MTSTQIKFSADASAVTAALQAVNDKAAEVNSTLNAGTVGIDTDKAQKDLDALLDTVEKLTEATQEAANAGHELDFDDVAKSAADAAKAAEDLANALNSQGAGGGGGASAVKQQVNDLKGLADTIERVRKVQAVLAQEGIQLSNRQAIEAKKRYDEWRRSGAAGSGKIKNVGFDDFVDGGWRKMALAEIDARRFRRQVLSAAGVDVSPLMPAPASKPTSEPRAPREPREPKQPTPKQVKTLAQFAAGAVSDAIGGVAHTATGGGGIGGRIAGRGFAEAAGSEGGLLSMGGIGRMAAGLGIGALAFGAVKAVGAIKDKVSDAQDEDTALTDLRHSMGQATTDFDTLRASLRDAARGLGVANNEVVALGSAFARTAGVAPGNERGLGDDVRTSIAFARSYGLDPSQGVGLFGTARHFGATSNDADNRRLAMMIGDAVAKAGSFAKVDEMIAAVQGFTERAARATLGAAPDMSGFLDQMSKLTGLHMNGLDTKGAANIIGQMTNTWHAGGGMGEASKNFRMRSFTNALPGFTAFDLDYVNAMDPNSTVEQAFGRDSSAYRVAHSRKDKARMAQLDAYVKKSGNRRLQDIDVDSIIAEYGNDTTQLVSALANHTGLSVPQANAYLEARNSGRTLGMTEARLREAGVDPSKVRGDYSMLAEIPGADANGLRQMARGYVKDESLPAGLRDKLQGILNGATDGNSQGIETLRTALIQIASVVSSPKDEGQRVREAVVDLKNVTQDMAAHLVPMTNDVREGILAIAQKLAPDSDRLKEVEAREFTPGERSLKSQYDDAVAARDAAMKDSPAAKAAEVDAEIKEFLKHHNGSDPATHATLKRLEAKKAQYLSADYSAKQQAALDEANRKLADVREKAAKEAESSGAGVYFKDWAKRVGGGGSDTDRDARLGELADHLGVGANARSGGPNGNVAAFKKQYGRAAEIAAKALNVSPDVVLGMWGNETGWGRSIIPGTNNLGNVKQFDGGGVEARDNMTGDLDRYRQYDSDVDFAKKWAEMLKSNFPGVVGAGGDARKFGEALMRGKNGRYATDPNYVSKLVGSAYSVSTVPQEAEPAGAAFARKAARGFGDMPLPGGGSAALAGPNGAMAGGAANSAQKFAFEHKIVLVDQLGRPRAAPVFTTQYDQPSPSGVQKG
jgi:flagellum-specific peptidoglycan hydrolase FlgJ